MCTIHTELVPAVTIVLADGHTQVTISPHAWATVSQTNTALSLSQLPIRREWSAKPQATYLLYVGGIRTLFCSTANMALSVYRIWPTGPFTSENERRGYLSSQIVDFFIHIIKETRLGTDKTKYIFKDCNSRMNINLALKIAVKFLPLMKNIIQNTYYAKITFAQQVLNQQRNFSKSLTFNRL